MAHAADTDAAGSMLVQVQRGLVMSLPSDHRVTSTYVAVEQGMWMEDEFLFLTEVVARPGDKIVDIGASFGFYSTNFSKTVGPAGRVIAYEPAPLSHRHLARTVRLNELEGVITVKQVALSDKSGEQVLLTDSTAPELNRLSAGDETAEKGGDNAMEAGEGKEKESEGGASSGGSNTRKVVVECRCLDDDLDDLAGASIVKMDCEGHERAVIDGGAKFFAQNDVLVMWEANDVGTLRHKELAAAWRAIGYSTFRYLPCGVLVPFGVGETPPAYNLNLFSCKASTARALHARGLLTFAAYEHLTQKDALPEALRTAAASWASSSKILSVLSGAPYPGDLMKLWVEHDMDETVLGCWGWYCAAVDATRTTDGDDAPALVCPADVEALLKAQGTAQGNEGIAKLLGKEVATSPAARRVALLARARDAFMHEAVPARGSVGRISTYARLAHEVGDRNGFVECMRELIRVIRHEASSPSGDPTLLGAAKHEPFLPVLPLMDAERVRCDDSVTAYFEHAARFAYVRRSAFSTCFVDHNSLGEIYDHLHRVVASGYFVKKAAAVLTALASRMDQLSSIPSAPASSASATGGAKRHIANRTWRDRIVLAPATNDSPALVTSGYYPVVNKSCYGVEDMKGKRVLVVGTYEGYWAVEAMRQGAASVVVAGMDGEVNWELYEVAVAAAKDAAAQPPQTVDITCLTDLCGALRDALPPGGLAFDVVLCFETFKAARHPLLLLDHLHSLARPAAGRVYWSAVVSDASAATIDLLPTHVTRPSAPSVLQMARAAGFGDTRAERLTGTSTMVLISAV